MRKHEKEKTTQCDVSFSPHVLLPYRYIPNALTILRLLGTPITVWMIWQDYLISALWTFFLICITDWFDGYLARRWQVVSQLGQVLDPLADKLLMISIYFTFGLKGLIPLWLTTIVLGRDGLILGMGSLILRQEKLHQKTKTSLEPKLIGKISTTLQMLLIGLILTRDTLISSIPPSSIGSILMVFFVYGVAFVTILSGIAYAQAAWKAWHT